MEGIAVIEINLPTIKADLSSSSKKKKKDRLELWWELMLSGVIMENTLM